MRVCVYQNIFTVLKKISYCTVFQLESNKKIKTEGKHCKKSQWVLNSRQISSGHLNLLCYAIRHRIILFQIQKKVRTHVTLLICPKQVRLIVGKKKF